MAYKDPDFQVYTRVGSISGFFVKDSTPRVGVEVDLYLSSDLNSRIAYTITDENGFWEFTGLSTDSYDVHFFYNGATESDWLTGLHIFDQSVSAGLDRSWMYDGTFSSPNNKTLSWTSGTLYFADGTTFSLSAGSITDLDANSYATRYVYFEKNNPTSTFQSTLPTEGVSDFFSEDTPLIASANGTSDINDNASFLVFAANATIIIKKIEATSGSIGAFTIDLTKIYSSGLEIVSGDFPYIGLNSSSFLDTSGIWFGKDSADSLWKMKLQDSGAGTRIEWDGSSLKGSTPEGDLFKLGSSSIIGGLTIGSIGLYTGDFVIYTGNPGFPALQIGPTTSYDFGSGVWIGRDPNDSVWKFNIGDFTKNHFTWDGSKVAAYDFNGSEIFSVQSDRSFIGGWYFDTAAGKILKSSNVDTENRLELNPTKNRYSVFEGNSPAAIEKVVSGFLEGLVKNNGIGTATETGTTTTLIDKSKDWKTDELVGLLLRIISGTNSGESSTILSNTKNTITVSSAFTSNTDSTSQYQVEYTANHYGFWAKQGDYLNIDGDISYDSGDWIIQNNGSLKIHNGSGTEIIRLGSYLSEKGLFLYDTYHNQIGKFSNLGIEIGSSVEGKNVLLSDKSTVWHFDSDLSSNRGIGTGTYTIVSDGKFSNGIYLSNTDSVTLDVGAADKTKGTILFYYNPRTNLGTYPLNLVFRSGVEITRETATSLRFVLKDFTSSDTWRTLFDFSLTGLTFTDNTQYLLAFKWDSLSERASIIKIDPDSTVHKQNLYGWLAQYDLNTTSNYILGGIEGVIDELMETKEYVSDETINQWFANQTPFSIYGRTVLTNSGFSAYNLSGEKTVNIDGQTGDSFFKGDITANSFALNGQVKDYNILDISYLDSNSNIFFHFDDNLLSMRGLQPTEFSPDYQLNPLQGKYGGGFVAAEATKNLLGESLGDSDGLTFTEAPGRWVANTGVTATVINETVQRDPFKNLEAYHLTLSGGTQALKYYMTVGTSVNGTYYSHSVWIKNIGTTDLEIEVSPTSARTTITAGAANWVLFKNDGNLGDGTQEVVLAFYTPTGSEASTLEFLAFEPQIETNIDCTAFTKDERVSNSYVAYHKDIISKKRKGTISFWFNPLLREAQSSAAKLFYLDDGAGNKFYLQYHFSFLRLYLYNNNVLIANPPLAGLADSYEGNYYYCVVRWDADLEILNLRYYNEYGVLLDEKEDTTWGAAGWPDFSGSGTDLYIGSKDKTTDFVNGLIDEFTIMDYYLDDVLVDNLVVQGKPFYDSNEDIIRGSGRIIIDNTGIRGYNNNILSPEYRMFELNTLTGNAYYAGELYAQGIIKTCPYTRLTQDFPYGGTTAYVTSTEGFSDSGTFWIVNGLEITYTGKTANSFTGCSGNDFGTYSANTQIVQNAGIVIDSDSNSIFGFDNEGSKDIVFGVDGTNSPYLGFYSGTSQILKIDSSGIDLSSGTLTGGIIRTSSNNKRVQLNENTNALEIFNFDYPTDPALSIIGADTSNTDITFLIGAYSISVPYTVNFKNTNGDNIFSLKSGYGSGSAQWFELYQDMKFANHNTISIGTSGTALKEINSVTGNITTLNSTTGNVTTLNSNSVEISSSEIINSSRQQTGSFKTRTNLIFGRNTSITVTSGTLTDYLAGADGCDPGIITIAKNCIVQTAAISTITAITIEEMDLLAEATISLEKSTISSNTWTNAGTLLLLDQTSGNSYGKTASNLNISLSVNDRIRVKVYLNAPGAGDSITLPNPQLSLGLLSE